ncbi:MAG: phage tail sheath subtilisin-like domain-containing protein [Vicinamibacterales bacterium]
MSPQPTGPSHAGAGHSQILLASTDVAAFVGHTAIAISGTRSVSLLPTRVSSLKEFEHVFGGPPAANTPYLLYDSVMLFFENGGTQCVVVSVGSYNDVITTQTLVAGLTPLVSAPEVSVVAMPETVRLSAPDSAEAQRALLAHCGTSTGNRFAILDLRDGNLPLQPAGPVDVFTNAIGSSAHRSFGAAYYPWVVVAPSRLNGGSLTLPPSGAVAGVFASVDNTRGVWKAPANVALSGVIAPAVAVTDSEQQELNAPISGVAVNAIRSFHGMGTLVWGARTLDSNNVDWRYISVRRTAGMIEESVGLFLKECAFSPNTSATWMMIRTQVEYLLTDLWKSGALQGITAKEAFAVRLGLGETMTAQDVADGLLVLELLLAVIHPAEFLVVRLHQKIAAP